MSTIQFRTAQLKFDRSTGSAQQESATVVFGSKVLQAEAAIKGFKIGYSGSDHEFKEEEIRISRVTVEGAAVKVDVAFALRDSSGTYDDPYEGDVEVLVTGIVEAAA